MSIEQIKARLDELQNATGPRLHACYGGEPLLIGASGIHVATVHTDLHDAASLRIARNALPGLIAAVRTAIEALTFIFAETYTSGHVYGLPHVADRANRTLAEIERLLEEKEKGTEE